MGPTGNKSLWAYSCRKGHDFSQGLWKYWSVVVNFCSLSIDGSGLNKLNTLTRWLKCILRIQRFSFITEWLCFSVVFCLNKLISLTPSASSIAETELWSPPTQQWFTTCTFVRAGPHMSTFYWGIIYKYTTLFTQIKHHIFLGQKQETLSQELLQEDTITVYLLNYFWWKLC